ncbi:MAG: TIR domain-containing protein [Burkholderiaceae bacterium]
MICTFYSYKGGVGRSMALANVADVLSRRGLRVLMIDFDLEAPGLEQFFFRDDERDRRDAIRRQSGLLDLLLDYKNAMSVAGSGDGFRQLDRYIANIYLRRPGGGRLDLIPAGQRLTAEQLDRYALALRSFDWQDFYFNWEGDLFFEWLRRTLVPERYDMVLVDSRTGVTEMGGICGYQLADLIVMLCGANLQNLDGTASMLDDFRSQSQAGLRRGRPLQILVVPARVEQQSQPLREAFHARFEQRFGDLLPPRVVAAGLGYRDLAIPYDPLFAFEERVARGLADDAVREHLAGVFGKLADVVAMLSAGDAEAGSAVARVAHDAASRLGEPVDDAAARASAASSAERSAVAAARYDETKRFADFDVMLDYARSDDAACADIARSLRARGLRVYTSASSLSPSDDFRTLEKEALAHSRVLVVLLGSSPENAFAAQRPPRSAGLSLDPHRRALLESALQAQAGGRRLRLVPVLLPGCPDGLLDPLLDNLRWIDLRGGLDSGALERLAGQLHDETAQAASAPMQTEPGEACAHVETESRCPWVGSAPIDEHRPDLLLGRDSEVAALLEIVESHSLTVIVGPSACGKTSLLRAGLLPMLRQRHPDWRICEAMDAPETGAPEQRRLAIFDDLQRHTAGDIVVAEPIAARFRERAAAGDRIVLCLRCEQFPAWRDALADRGTGQSHRFDLNVPDEAALRMIVERPADAAGLAFEPGLVDRIVSRSVGERGVLPFLQITLQRLWEQRREGWLTNAAYDRFGGIRAVVIEAANRHFASLTETGQAQAKRILLRLVANAGDTRRAEATVLPYSRVAATDTQVQAVARDPGTGDGAERSVLANLVEARLLATSLEHQEAMVELAHEALARDWPRMQVWLEQEREFLAWQRRLSAEIATWDKAGRPADQLLRGTALDEAVKMNEGHRLAPEEDEFIAASVDAQRRHADERDRARRRSLRIWTTTSVMFLMIAVAAGIGWRGERMRRASLEQLDGLVHAQMHVLAQEQQAAERQRDEAMRQIEELQRTLDQALTATRAYATARRGGSSVASDAGRTATGEISEPGTPSPASSVLVVEELERARAQLERARAQAGQVAESQAGYTNAQAENISRQQDVLRQALPDRLKAFR